MGRSKRPPYSGTPPTPISFDLEQPEFGMVTYVGKRVSRGLATPPSQGAGSQRPQILWNLLHARTQHENQRPNFSWRSSYRCSENIYRSTTPTARAKCLATRMLTRDLFALANLVACSSTITAISGHTNLFKKTNWIKPKLSKRNFRRLLMRDFLDARCHFCYLTHSVNASIKQSTITSSPEPKPLPL